MARVICKLENASEMINGVKFVSHKLGMISEEIADDVAAHFRSVKGFVLATEKGKEVEPPAVTGETGATGATGATGSTGSTGEPGATGGT